MANPINILDETVFAPGRNAAVSYNYAWDEKNSYWTPLKSTSLSYDNIVGQASDFIHKFGSNPDISNTVSSTSPETVWDGSNEYTFPPDSGTGIQIKSSQGADAQEFVVQGLDENFELQTWTGNLNGTSDVDVDGTWTRVFRAFNNDSSEIAGNINIHASGDALTSYAQVLLGNDQTLMSLYTIPANYTGYLCNYNLSAHNAGSATVIGYTVQLKTRNYGKVFRVQEVAAVTTENSYKRSYPFPLTLAPKTDILINVVSANGNNGSVNSDFDIALLQ